MIIEMARQRDRQKKRLLNLCIMRQMEASLEMVSKKRGGTTVIKETFEELTGETWHDVPKRVVPHSYVAATRQRQQAGGTKQLASKQ
ncbi:hypothetical protein PINS_up005194 [Pythium insidiosum]|nr:hypothetical protein PINS_up005194 [Pythium insidiosum]